MSSYPTVDELKKLRVVDLKERLSKLGKSTAGLKADLVDRLFNVLREEAIADEDEEEEEDDEEGEELGGYGDQQCNTMIENKVPPIVEVVIDTSQFEAMDQEHVHHDPYSQSLQVENQMMPSYSGVDVSNSNVENLMHDQRQQHCFNQDDYSPPVDLSMPPVQQIPIQQPLMFVEMQTMRQMDQQQHLTHSPIIGQSGVVIPSSPVSQQQQSPVMLQSSPDVLHHSPVVVSTPPMAHHSPIFIHSSGVDQHQTMILSPHSQPIQHSPLVITSPSIHHVPVVLQSSPSEAHHTPMYVQSPVSDHIVQMVAASSPSALIHHHHHQTQMFGVQHSNEQQQQQHEPMLSPPQQITIFASSQHQIEQQSPMVIQPSPTIESPHLGDDSSRQSQVEAQHQQQQMLDHSNISQHHQPEVPPPMSPQIQVYQVPVQQTPPPTILIASQSSPVSVAMPSIVPLEPSGQHQMVAQTNISVDGQMWTQPVTMAQSVVYESIPVAMEGPAVISAQGFGSSPIRMQTTPEHHFGTMETPSPQTSSSSPPPPGRQMPPSLMSLDVAKPTILEDTLESADGEVDLPHALEKALAFKSERAHELGVDPDVVQGQTEEVVEEERVNDVADVEEERTNNIEVEKERVNDVTVVLERAIDVEKELERANDFEEVIKRAADVVEAVDEVEVVPEKVPSPVVPKTQEPKPSKNKRRKMKKKKRAKQRRDEAENPQQLMDVSTNEETGETEDVEVQYVQDSMDLNPTDPMYGHFMKIFEAFKLTDPETAKREAEEAAARAKAEAKKEPDLRKKPKDADEEPELDLKKEEVPKLSKRKLKMLNQLSIAELKQHVNRPDVVEMHDVTAKDPKLLVILKSTRNTVSVPRHWCFKRKYLQGKRGIEKPPFNLPDFIKKTGIMEMRQALQEKEDQKTMKAKMRERVRPKMGKIDIDYQKLHDAFFKWQTKPRMTIHGDLYYEGKEMETRLREKKPGDLSTDLRNALGMPTGPNSHKVPPPWLIAMQRYGPPPSYPNLKIPGLNSPIPDNCSFGYHAGGWGKPPVDEMGKPLYGDVFGTAGGEYHQPMMEEEIDRTLWGELESESESESEEEEEEEEEAEGDMTEMEEIDRSGLATPSDGGLITPSGISSIPAGMETPDMIELRKRKIESEMESVDAPALYTILPERKTDRLGAAMMGSTHIYDITAAMPGRVRPPAMGGVGDGGVEVALDPSELDMDSAAMAARYEQTLREQQNQLEKEDLSDMVAEHTAKQKNKRKRAAGQQDSGRATKKYKDFKF